MRTELMFTTDSPQPALAIVGRLHTYIECVTAGRLVSTWSGLWLGILRFQNQLNRKDLLGIRLSISKSCALGPTVTFFLYLFKLPLARLLATLGGHTLFCHVFSWELQLLSRPISYLRQ